MQHKEQREDHNAAFLSGSVTDGRLTVAREFYRLPLAEPLCPLLQEEDGVHDADGKSLCLVSTLGDPGLAGVPLRGAVVYTLGTGGTPTQP